MRSRTLTLAALLSAAPGAAAQTSKYIVTAGSQGKMAVLQNHAMLRQWDLVEEVHPIAIVPGSGQARTVGYKPGLPGRIYDFFGNVVGGVLHHDIPGRFYDSTSDGAHNYMIDYDTENVWSTDLNFKNEKLLFNVDAMLQWVGITYDPRNDSLWVSAWNDDIIANFTLDGTLITYFHSGHVENTALAFDPADNTLWLCAHSVPGAFEQWHTSGVRLFSEVIPGMENLGCNGGEIAACYPDFDGSGDLNLFDFLGFTNAFNAADPQADCDGDGQFNLFDFLCFTNAFNAGC